ncbi:hypothetical protein ASG29_11395 [Sphingomonas sp. Leaf412]|uniref:DUF5076 domain-containing protein n=1 Tax=Sphingomonas sp. Leaf412 TaxID=1736370 RepID=UPI0006FC806B|nr:DUF5076 domain-containing protein [Sphingomonas sp. Leaf412]KQT32388.1 hypothetical protein ASG29_11395 [Sphingomonas sp. Leaf412]
MKVKPSDAAPAMASGEFLRAVNVPGGSTSYIIDPGALAADPLAFGMALVDCVRHGARAWSQATGVDEETVRDRIWEGLDAERARNTTELN